MSRYFRRSKAINSTKQYRKMLKNRGRKAIEQYRTPVYTPIDQKVLDSIETYNYIFTVGDTFYKIADSVYGDQQYWWIIASFNRTPTISHLKVGDIIKVPTDLTEALGVLE